MTMEEIEELIKKTSGELDCLTDDSEKTLTREEKRRKLVLQLKASVLQKMRQAKKQGNSMDEIRAGADYAMLEKYGEKHPLILQFLFTRFRWSIY